MPTATAQCVLTTAWTLAQCSLTAQFLLVGTVLAWFAVCTVYSFGTSQRFFFPVSLIYLFIFPSHFPSLWSLCNLQPIEVYKDVHGRRELIG